MMLETTGLYSDTSTVTNFLISFSMILLVWERMRQEMVGLAKFLSSVSSFCWVGIYNNMKLDETVE